MKSKFVKSMALLCVFCIGLWSVLTPAASARTGAPATVTRTSTDTFRGTRLELVAYVLPQMLERAGYQVRVAESALARQLQQEFGGRKDFLWSSTIVRPAGKGLDFTVTLPADEGRLRQGVIALGILKDGKLASARVVTMTRDGVDGKTRLTLSRPDGTLISDRAIATGKDGTMRLSASQIESIAADMENDTRFGGLELLIELLNQVMDLLYFVRDIINMAICAAEEVQELLYDVIGCGLGSTTPGGGNGVDTAVCTVGATIEMVNELMSRCF